MRPLRVSLHMTLCLLTISAFAFAQVPYEYTHNPYAPILDNSTTASSITISDVFTISDLNILVDIDHSFAADLTITISHNGGPPVTLSANNGSYYPDYRNTIFDDQALSNGYLNGGNVAAAPYAGFNGVYEPQSPLSTFNGQSGSGTWTISVNDNATLDEGTLNRWGLVFNRSKYKDIRLGIDYNSIGQSYISGFGSNAIGITIPPFTVHGKRPEVNSTFAYIITTNSADYSMTKLTAKEYSPGGVTLLNAQWDTPYSQATINTEAGPISLMYVGMNPFHFTAFQRWGLFMANSDDHDMADIVNSPASLGYDNGKMANWINFLTPECNAIAAPIYQEQLLTSIDFYQAAAAVEAVGYGTGSVDVNVWEDGSGLPTTILGTSFTHTLPPQGDKWVSYAFNPPVVLPAGWYAFGMCVTSDPTIGGIGLGVDLVTTFDPYVGKYQDMYNQLYTYYGYWYEDFYPFVNKMIRPNFILGIDLGTYTINSPSGTSSGSQSVSATFKSYNHQPQIPNALATCRVTIQNSMGNTVYTSERRATFAPYSTQTVSFDTFVPPDADTYTITALVTRNNASDDENLINNSYSRTFTILSPIAPVIVSEDGALNQDQRNEIASSMKAKGLDVQFKNRTTEGIPFETSNAILFVGDLSSVDNTTVQSYVNAGNYFGVISTKQMDIGKQLVEKLTPASDLQYLTLANNKLQLTKEAMRFRTSPKPTSNLLIDKKMNILASGSEAEVIEERHEGMVNTLQTAKNLIDAQPAVSTDDRKAQIGYEGQVKVRQIAMGSMSLAEVVSAKSKYPAIVTKAAPTEFVLAQNYPNPFNPTTTIAYSLPSTSYVTLRVYDLLGREVTTLFQGSQNQGRYNMQWDGDASYGSPAASGIYLYRFEATPADGGSSFVMTKKMVLQR